VGGDSVRTAQVIILITPKRKNCQGRPGANRTGNYSYHPKKKKIARAGGESVRTAQVIILITPKRKKLPVWLHTGSYRLNLFNL